MKTRIIKDSQGCFQIQYHTKFLWWESWNDSYIFMYKDGDQELSHQDESDICWSRLARYSTYARAHWVLFPTKKYDHLSIGCYGGRK